MKTKEPNNEVLESHIGHHGAYIWETKIILEEYVRLKDYEKVKKRVVRDNILNKGSEYYREDILKEVFRRYSLPKNEYEDTPLLTVSDLDLSDSILEWVLYYEFSQDALVNKLTKEFLFPLYSDGRLTITKKQVIEYIKELGKDEKNIQDWSENTVEHVGQHYLAALDNFDILEGNSTKEFKLINPPKEVIGYTFYSLFEEENSHTTRIIEDPEWKLYFFPPEDTRRNLEKISPEFLHYEKRGTVERINPNYTSLQEFVNDL